MFKSYLIIAFRNLRKQKIYSLINISGLALGMTAFLIIAFWVWHEISHDRFHEHAGRIYRVAEKRHFPDQVRLNNRTPGPLCTALKENFPEIRSAARVAWTGERVLRYQDEVHYADDILTVDPDFLRIFTFPMIVGDSAKALDEPFSVVVTESAAVKYFGNEDPLGKVLNLDNRFDLTVTGVMEDVPDNSHLQFGMLVPFEMVERLGWDIRKWGFSMALTYLLLGDQVDIQAFEEKIAGNVKKYDEDTNIELFLQPLTRLYLFTNIANPDAKGRIQYLLIFSLVGILILFMACFNFMNLTTARSEYRAKEIGLRKVVGATRKHLVRQFLAEAIFLAFAALLITAPLIQLFLPVFNKITGESFSMSNFTNVWIFLFVIGVTVIVGLTSGSYPALVLSSFQPVKVLQGGQPSRYKGSVLRKILVFVQMSISLVLIIVSSIIFQQIGFIKNKDLGFDQEHVVSFPLGIANQENSQIFQSFKDIVKQNPRIVSVTASFTHPTDFATQVKNVVYKGKRIDEDIPINLTSVEYGFIETLKIKMLKGRSFNQEFGAEKGNLLVNQSFEKLLGVESALDEVLHIGPEYQGRIIGVMQDFHLEAVSMAVIGPLIVFLNPNVNHIFVRIQPENIPATLEFLKTAWRKSASNRPFAYNFLDEEFNRLYTDVENLGTALRYFTFFAVCIACLGLLGLTSFSIEKRTKEIGIRKILGSSVSGILTLLCRDYVRVVLLAILCAWPISWWLMFRWLQNFPYRVSLSWTNFVLSALLILVITLVTVSFQTIKAARADPVKSLRYE
ncbi:MAG: FtsX-like permease family protein [Candidatus Aminicenantes bacterium]|nr:FtsX-like permease family protein [Candidatus Aminicenantes bacterium]